MNESWSILLARIVGAMVGASISLTFLAPRSWREALAYFWSGLILGILFGHVLTNWFEKQWSLDFGSEIQSALAGTCLVALFGWVFVAVVYRIIRNIRSVRDLKNHHRRDE